MQASTSDHIAQTPEDLNDIAVRPGYIVRPINNKEFLVPAVLSEEDLSLTAVEVPDLSAIMDKGAGVSHLGIELVQHRLIESGSQISSGRPT